MYRFLIVLLIIFCMSASSCGENTGYLIGAAAVVGGGAAYYASTDDDDDDKFIFVPTGTGTGTFTGTNTSGGTGGQTGTFTISISINGKDIYMIVTAPDTGGAPAPLKVWLHGDGATPADFSTLVDNIVNGHALSAGWIIYRPYAPDNPDPDVAFHWWRCANRIEAILAVVDHAKANYTIDNNRVYLAGFSGGASTTSTVGRAHGEIFAACGMHCGLPMGTSISARKAPYYVYCGASDPMYTLYPYVADDLIAAGHEVEYLVGPTGHDAYQPAFDANHQFFLNHTLN